MKTPREPTVNALGPIAVWGAPLTGLLEWVKSRHMYLKAFINEGGTARGYVQPPVPAETGGFFILPTITTVPNGFKKCKGAMSTVSHTAKQSAMRPVQVGLLGYGGVGSAFVRHAHSLKEPALRVNVKRALVRDGRKSRPADTPPGLLTTDPREILDDPEIEVVVEVMSGLEPARTYLVSALEKGKAVVTGNKQVVAEGGHGLRLLAKELDVPLCYEASVGAIIPVIHTIQRTLAADRIVSLRAVLNGTSNYILDRMAVGLPLDKAVAEAQKLGYAEPDPSDDLSGRDAAWKLAVLCPLIYDQMVDVDDIDINGIADLEAEEVRRLRDEGHAVRLVAAAQLDEGGTPKLKVAPEVLPIADPLAQLEGPENGFEIHSETVGRLFLAGPGAGPSVTSIALLGDVYQAARLVRAKNSPVDFEPVAVEVGSP